MTDIEKNLREIRQRIEKAAEERAIDLIAVSKFKTIDDVRDALRAGQRVFGENRVQEARKKFVELRNEYPDLTLHLIGPLQTNKADEAVQVFDVIQTIDRPSLAEAVAKAIQKTGKTPRLYIEVNIGDEPQKAGVVEKELDSFIDFARSVCGLVISGLMCIPPQSENPEPYFHRMKTLADHYKMTHLSMGMSGDFEMALRCGATEVRVGTGIFGVRN